MISAIYLKFISKLDISLFSNDLGEQWNRQDNSSHKVRWITHQTTLCAIQTPIFVLIDLEREVRYPFLSLSRMLKHKDIIFENPNFSAVYYSMPSQSPLSLVKETVQELRQIEPHVILCHSIPEALKKGSLLIIGTVPNVLALFHLKKSH